MALATPKQDEQAIAVVRGDLVRRFDGTESDPITTEVIRHGLNAAATQMAVALKRTAFSPVIYEVNDFACALYDRHVRLLAQAQIFPMFLGTLNFCVQSAVAAVGGEEALEPGDVLFTSYAYDIGSHQQDAAVVIPGFVGDELVGYAAIKAHHMDIGAKEPYCTDTVDVFQEGAIFPGVKLYRAGELVGDMYRTLLANSRLPKAFAGDLNAEIGAARAGLTGLYRLLEKYGRETFEASVERLFDHGEATIRRFLETVPDGRYVGTGAMDSNGIDGELVPIEIALEIEGNTAVVDFGASAPEQRGPVNCPLASSVSAARMAVMALAGAQFVNEGHFRAVEIRAREGTMFHPRPPAPVYLYFWSALQAIDVIHRSLTDAVPELVGAGTGGDICCVVWWGWDEAGSMWSDASNHFCGQGASESTDGGAPLIHVSAAGMRNSPAEVWEAQHPMVVEKMEYIEDSGGPGRHRGGLGVEQRYRAVRECYFTSTIERSRTAPWGLQGGRDGQPNDGHIEYPDGSRERCTKATGVRLPAGATLVISMGSGAGFGPPAEREPDLVHIDVRAGYVSEDEARSCYPHAFPSHDQEA